MRLTYRFSRDDRAVRISDENRSSPRLLKHKGDEVAQSGCLMFQIVNIEFSVGFSAKKCETILPGNSASRRIECTRGKDGTAKRNEVIFRSSRSMQQDDSGSCFCSGFGTAAVFGNFQ